MGGWMCRWVDGWVDGWTGGWIDRWVGGWMDGWMDGWLTRSSPAGILSSEPPGLAPAPAAAPAPRAASPSFSSAPPLCPGARPRIAAAPPPCRPVLCPASPDSSRHWQCERLSTNAHPCHRWLLYLPLFGTVEVPLLGGFQELLQTDHAVFIHVHLQQKAALSIRQRYMRPFRKAGADSHSS